TVRLRLAAAAVAPAEPFADFAAVFADRIEEADAFYAGIQRGMTDPDAKLVQRQAFAGLIWTKQFYYYDVPTWVRGDPGQPVPPPGRGNVRNGDWTHLTNDD